MSAISLLVLLTLAPTAATPVSNGMPVHITAPWTIEVGPGKVTLSGQEIDLKEAVSLTVPPVQKVVVKDEKIDSLPVFNPNAGGWIKGAKPRPLTTEECTAAGYLLPESFKLKNAQGTGSLFVTGKDYDIDSFWGTFGRLEGGAIKEGQPVWIDYEYLPGRLDSVVVDKKGKVKYAEGKPVVALAQAPTPAPGETAIVNIWLEKKMEGLSDKNLFPIEEVKTPASTGVAQAEKLLPKTLAKLRAGQEVTIVAWGDSVTDGGGVTNTPDMWYQHQFAKSLGERFPKAKIKMLTAAWGGRCSQNYLDAPRGGEKDFVRDVLEPKPDLVTIEFVNDAYYTEDQTQVQYKKLMELLQGNGSEVILITPHLVRPDWMQVDSMKFDEDPRPYVRGLYRFAKENGVALADATRLWLQLWRQGIPYITLEANSINHPDARGHRLFSEALMAVFPGK